MLEADSISCRICKTCSGHDLMKSPCLCKGTLGYVHFSCLEQWLNQSSKDYCELCRYQFRAVRRRRYGLVTSICVWIRNPTNRSYLCYDLIITVILTFLTFAIIFICLVGAGILKPEGHIGIENTYVRGVVLMFLMVLLTSYVTTLYLIVQDHVRPWYNWWKNCVHVKLLIEPRWILTLKNPNNSMVPLVALTDSRSQELINLTTSFADLGKGKQDTEEKSKTLTAARKSVSEELTAH